MTHCFNTRKSTYSSKKKKKHIIMPHEFKNTSNMKITQISILKNKT